MLGSIPAQRSIWLGKAGPAAPDEVQQAADTAGIISADVPMADQSLFEANGMRAPDQPRASMVRWLSPGSPPLPSARAGWLVRSRLGFAHGHQLEPGQPTPGVKQISFVKRRPDIDSAEFDERYRHHIEVTKTHHGGVWQYAQSLVEEPLTADAPPIDGISELWFQSIEDFTERFYSTPESPDAVRDDTVGFIDFSGTFSVLVVDHQFADPS